MYKYQNIVSLYQTTWNKYRYILMYNALKTVKTVFLVLILI